MTQTVYMVEQRNDTAYIAEARNIVWLAVWASREDAHKAACEEGDRYAVSMNEGEDGGWKFDHEELTLDHEDEWDTPVRFRIIERHLQ